MVPALEGTRWHFHSSCLTSIQNQHVLQNPAAGVNDNFLRLPPLLLPMPVRSSDQAHIKEVRQCISAFLSFDAAQYGGYAGRMWPDLLQMCYPGFKNCRLENMIAALVDRCCFHRDQAKFVLFFSEYFNVQFSCVLKVFYSACLLE